MKFYREDRVIDVPQAENDEAVKKGLESIGWSDKAPKAKKKAKELEVPSLTEKNIDDNSE